MYDIACLKSSFLCMTEYSSTVGLDHIFSFHSSVDGHLGFYCHIAIRVSTSTCTQVTFERVCPVIVVLHAGVFLQGHGAILWLTGCWSAEPLSTATGPFCVTISIMFMSGSRIPHLRSLLCVFPMLATQAGVGGIPLWCDGHFPME